MKHLKLLFALLFCSLLSQAKMATDTPSVSCYPNPFSDKLNVSIDSKTPQPIAIQVYDMMGRLVLTDTLIIVKGVNNLSYSLAAKASAAFIVVVNGQNWSRNQRVIHIHPDPTRSDSIDIVHYDISLSIQNLISKTISGTTIVTIDPKVDSLTTIKLDLLKLNVTDVKVNNVSVSFSKNDSELYVVINRKNSPNADSLIDVAITYNGQPVSDPQWGGFYFNGDYAYNMGVAFKSVPHNFGRCWFPCIDNFTDRATYTFHITTDPTFKGVCNGLILPETANGDGSTTWNWEMKQPIPTYLASVAVGKYEFVKYEFQGINRTYPVWLAVVATDTTKAKTSFAKLNNALQCFESKYGAYPFDRIGYVGVPFNSGAMEHATNIAYPNYAINGTTSYETLFAHELSHMWWGDLATCSTAEDMWLNEGWASFNEALFLECVYGKAAYINDIKDKSIEVLLSAPKTDGGWYPVSGIPQNITYGTHVYKKGALMVHSLRTLMGDSAFFEASKNYLAKFHFADVNSEDLKKEFQRFTTVNLTNFFQKWIYSPGHSDVVVSKYESSMVNNEHHYRLEFSELQRKNNIISGSLPLSLHLYRLNSSNPLYITLELVNGTAVWEQTLSMGESIVGWAINEDKSLYLGNNFEQLHIQQTGTLTLPNVLMGLNVQSMGNGGVANGNNMFVTHHWVGALDYNLKAKGIRISGERYWTIGGYYKDGFKTWGFFNYDGTSTSYLDSELITQSEDSLILLYRPFPGGDWLIHSDNTFQPGPSKTDKTGRFWVNDLKNGEYAFGVRDAGAVGLQEVQTNAKPSNSFRIIPNPSSEQWITLQFKSAVMINEIQLLDAKGVVLKTITVNKTSDVHELSVGEFATGNYFIAVKTPEGTTSKQFIRK
ncbi:MAG: M1 family aminopeptidase [Bacteroidota bacterium]